jgi:hypothetical protein
MKEMRGMRGMVAAGVPVVAACVGSCAAEGSFLVETNSCGRRYR